MVCTNFYPQTGFASPDTFERPAGFDKLHLDHWKLRCSLCPAETKAMGAPCQVFGLSEGMRGRSGTGNSSARSPTCP